MNAKTQILLFSFVTLLVIVLAVTFWPKQGAGPDLKIPGWGAGRKVEKAEEESPIDRVEVETGGKKATVARVDKGKWSLTPPEGARADRYKVRQVLDAFREGVASVISTVPKTSDLPSFGLDDATRVRVALFQGGTQVATLDIGQVQKPEAGAQGEGDTFVRVPGQERVYRVIGRDLRRPLADGLKGLRDKRVFDWEAGDVTGVTIENPGAADEVDRKIVLASDEKKPEGEAPEAAKKPERAWRFEAPAGVPAGDVRTFAGALASLYVQEYADELPEGVAIGPDAYRVAVTLTGDRKAGVALSASKDDAAWVRVDGVPGVAKLTKYAADSLRKRAGDLRDKAVFGLRRDQVVAFEADDHGRRVRVERDGNDWKAVEPAGLPLGRPALEQLAADIEALRADAFVGTADLADRNTGLEEPGLTVAVTGRDGTRKVLRVGSEKDKGVRYARLEGRPEVFTLADWMLAKVRKGPADLRNKTIFPFAADDIARIEIARKDETLVLEAAEVADPAKEAGWRAVAPSAAALKPEPVRTLAATLAGLQAKEIPPGTTARSLAKAPVDLVVTVTLKDGSRHVLKVLGQKKDADPWAVSPTARDFRDAAFTLNPYQVQNLDKRLAELKQ